ncbi:PQQ-dependent sugar dehydrogenase [Novosphingobium kunmingense]|nr:PQQ-dependent sugar dehydrogenase [Novosphingobium kunmingense]
MFAKIVLSLSPLPLLLASCGATTAGDSPGAASEAAEAFAREELATFNEPWAAAVAPGTQTLFVTEKSGAIRYFEVASKRQGSVTGAPTVDYGGQGGLGDIAFLPSESAANLARRTIFLTWAEAGGSDTRGAALGRGTLVCNPADACRIEGLSVIWRQQPKVTGRGHYSHRIVLSPDGKFLFVASGDRQKMTPAQDPASDLGKVIRLPIDAQGNPTGPAERYSLGHRNILGLTFDASGRLWDLEHGPAGGDELNLVEQGQNYGWPLVSDGDHYDGRAIPRNSTRPDLAAPAISWNPVIAPGDFLFYSGKMWPAWKGQALIAGMGYEGLVRVSLSGTKGTEQARYPMGKRIREIVEAPDGSLLLLEDKAGGRLVRLSKK